MACNERVSKDERVRDASEYRAVNNVPTCTELNMCVCVSVCGSSVELELKSFSRYFLVVFGVEHIFIYFMQILLSLHTVLDALDGPSPPKNGWNKAIYK